MTNRLASVRERIAASGLDALLVSDLTNIRWLTGFTGSNGWGVLGPDSLVLVTDGRYGHQAAEQMAAAGVVGEVRVGATGAATLQHVADVAAANHVTTIFFEENLPPDLSQTVADEVGASTAVLDPIESLSADQVAAGDDYVSLMDTNLAALRKGLGCT